MHYYYASLPEEIKKLEYSGNFDGAIKRIEWLLNRDIDKDLRGRLEYELERIRRLRKDFCFDEKQAREILRKELGDEFLSKFDEYLRSGFLDYIIIDGKRYYFCRFIDNLLFLCDKPECKRAYEERTRKRVKIEETLIKHVEDIVNSGKEGFVYPRTVRIRMKLGVSPGTLEPGETAYCGCPTQKYPSNNHP